MKNYFSKSKEEVLQELQVTENGLNSQEVKERVKKYGKNQLNGEGNRSTLAVFYHSLKIF